MTIEWTDEQVERLKTLFAGGASFEQIAYEVCTSANGARDKIAKLGLVRTDKKPARGTKWTPEEDEQLKKLYAEQYSCSQIADMMGGITRNSVIGRVHRLGLEKRGPRGPGRPRTKLRNLSGPRPLRARFSLPPIELEAMRCAPVEPLNISFADLEKHHCRWPDNSRPFTYCGHQNLAGLSYCLQHYLLSIGTGTPSERSADRIAPHHLTGSIAA